MGSGFVFASMWKLIYTNCFHLFVRYFPKSSKAAALLLYNMWSEKDLQSFLKKVSRRLIMSAKICQGLGVSFLFPTANSRSTPFSGICEKQREKGWRIRQRSQNMPTECEWDIKSDLAEESSSSGLWKHSQNFVCTCTEAHWQRVL